jgi:hypothetical protein
MSSNSVAGIVVGALFVLGLSGIAWIGAGFVGTSPIALAMTLAIAGAYLLGAAEVLRFRQLTLSLLRALNDIPQPLLQLQDWLDRVHPALRSAVRLRVEGERSALPGLSITPYLVGLLVMLGMLGTFLGMVLTFKGAVFALEGSADLQAVRSALAEPIRGLALAFGTSVAGVAASAMLGLMSVVSRRERLEAARQLDGAIAGTLLPFSLAWQRKESFRALQSQAQALPEVARQLQAVAQQIEQRNEQLNEGLLQRQAQFHAEAAQAYSGLAQSVEQSLKQALGASAAAAGASMQPIVETAMSAIAGESRATQQQLAERIEAQLDTLLARFSASAAAVTEGWQAGVAAQARSNEALTAGLDRTLAAFSSDAEQRSAALLAGLQQSLDAAQARQQQATAQAQAAWTENLEALGGSLRTQWQEAAQQMLERQSVICRQLEGNAAAIAAWATEQAARTEDGIMRMSASSAELLRVRGESETRWSLQQEAQMQQLAALWRSELAALRNDESERGEAAVRRLEQLQAAVATHLATLGAALEEPLGRLLNTASEVPQAAAEVIAELRQEMSRLTERDNLALQERAGLMQGIAGLLQSVQQATGEQRTAIESLVSSASAVLEQVGRQFEETLGAQGARSEEAATQLVASAIELASLGDAFHHGVGLFSASNEQLMQNLQQMEAAIAQSLARSDEQLAYYVAQAREVIDLSISAQHGVVEELRRLQERPAALADGEAA